MITLLALYFASIANTSVSAPLKVGHCYTDDRDFDSRVIKILEVMKTEYKYKLYTNGEVYGDFVNFKETLENNYPNEVKCEKK